MRNRKKCWECREREVKNNMYCPNCGHQVEQNDKYCMKCGHPLLENDVPSVITEPVNPNRKSRWLVPGICFGIITLMGFIIFALNILLGDTKADTSADAILSQGTVETETSDEDVSVQSDTEQDDTAKKNDEKETLNKTDSLPESETDSKDAKEKSSQIYVKMEETEESEVPKTQEVAGTQGPTTYNEILDNLYARYANGDTLIYVMYDIDKNGVQEMLVSEGASDAECVWNVYTKVDGKVISTGTCPGAYSSLCATPDGYLYMVNCNNNYEELYRTYLADNTLSVSLVETRTVNDKSEYYYPKGEYLTGKRITDRSLINE